MAPMEYLPETHCLNKTVKKLLNISTTVAVNLCRALLAVTFVASGFVKAVDPMGTQYKLADYFVAWNLGGILPEWGLTGVAVLLSGIEFLLGVLLLFAIRRRLSTKLTLVFMVVMTGITLYSYLTGSVADCGCFGDAIKLTNGQTLAKNVVLLFMAVVVTASPLRMHRFVSESNQWIVINYSALFILGVSAYSLYALPLLDFRPYHVGQNLPKAMEIPPGAPQPEFETTFILKKNGVTKTFTIDNYPDSTWEFVDSKTVQTKSGFVPPIPDFIIENRETGDEVTSELLDRKGDFFLLAASHLEQADNTDFGDINRIFEYAQEHHIPFYCLTASPDEAVERWQQLTGAEYTFFRTDETVLKTMIRSNPGLLLLHNGTVVGKWSRHQLPTNEELSIFRGELAKGNLPKYELTKSLLSLTLWFVLPLALLTLADRLWTWTKWVRKRKNS